MPKIALKSLYFAVFRFSNATLQAIMLLVKKQPPREDGKLLVIATTSEPDFMRVSAWACFVLWHLNGS